MAQTRDDAPPAPPKTREAAPALAEAGAPSLSQGVEPRVAPGPAIPYLTTSMVAVGGFIYALNNLITQANARYAINIPPVKGPVIAADYNYWMNQVINAINAGYPTANLPLLRAPAHPLAGVHNQVIAVLNSV